MALRLRSDVQVSALQRQVEAAGLFFSVLHHGHDEGGLILITWVEGRAAQIYSEQSINDERRWVRRHQEPKTQAEVTEFIQSERSFDADLWVVEVMGPFSKADSMLDPVEL